MTLKELHDAARLGGTNVRGIEVSPELMAWGEASCNAYDDGALIEAPACTACGGGGKHDPLYSRIDYDCPRCHGTGHEPMVPLSSVGALVEAALAYNDACHGKFPEGITNTPAAVEITKNALCNAAGDYAYEQHEKAAALAALSPSTHNTAPGDGINAASDSVQGGE